MSWFKKLIGKPSPAESAQRVADGVILARRGKSEQALLAYQEAIRLDPGNAVAHLNAALAQQDIFNRDLGHFEEEAQKQKLLEIQQSLDKALALAPESHIAWRVAAYVARKQGHVVEALDAFERTLEFAPEGFEHRDEVEQALQQVRPLAERERILRRAMDVAARNDVVPQESAEALTNLETHLEAAEAKPDWFWAAGVLSRHVGNAEQAKKHFALCLEMERHHSHAHRELATLYMRDGQLEQALHHSLEAYREDPSNPALVCNVGVCFLEVGDLEQAGEYLHLARDMAPSDPIIGRAIETWSARSHGPASQ